MALHIHMHTNTHVHAQAVKPIALAKVMNISRMIAKDYPNKGISMSGIGGVETGADAAEFILLGSDTVQVGRALLGSSCMAVGVREKG